MPAFMKGHGNVRERKGAALYPVAPRPKPL